MKKINKKVCCAIFGGILALASGVFVLNSSEVKQVEAKYESCYTLTPAKGTNNAYDKNCDVEISGIKWNVTGNSQTVPWRLGGKKSNCSGVDRNIYCKSAITGDVTRVDVSFGDNSGGITINSVKLGVYSTADLAAAGAAGDIDDIALTYSESSTVSAYVPATHSWKNRFYNIRFNLTVTVNSNNYVQFSGAKFYTGTADGYSVTYDANGATSGEVPTDSKTYTTTDNQVTVLGNPGNLVKSPYAFDGWSLTKDGEKVTSFTISKDETLYARWVYTPLPYDHAGTLEDPFSPKDAWNKAYETGTTATTNYYYVTGVVSSVVEFSTSFGNFTFVLTEDTYDFTGYRLLNGSSKAKFTDQSELEVGDIVTIYTPIQLYSGTTPETTTDGYVYSIVKEAEVLVAAWIKDYMHMDSDVPGQCSGSLNYYATAKTALLNLGDKAVNEFKNNGATKYTAAYERYTAWARACHDDTPFESSVSSSNGLNILESSNATIIIAAASLLLIVASVFVIIRKKKLA